MISTRGLSKLKEPSFALNLSFSLLLIMFMVAVALRTLFAFSYLPETGGDSVNVLFELIRLTNGHSIYTDPQLPPYSIIQYMPLNYYMVAVIGKIFGLQGNIHGIIVLHRVLCLLFDLAALLVIYDLVIAVFAIKSKRILWAIGFCSFLNLTYHFYSRVDSLYFLTFVLALNFFFKYLSYEEQRKLPMLILSSLFASLCLFTKQTGLFEIGGFGLFLLLFKRDWKHIFIFAFSTVGFLAVLSVFMIDMHALTSFYNNVVLGVKNGLNHSYYRGIIAGFFFKKYLFVVAGLYLAGKSMANKAQPVMQFMGFFSLFLFIISTVTCLKNGADINYFTEFILLTLIQLAIYFAKPTDLRLRAYAALVLTPYIIISFFFSGMCSWNLFGTLKKEKVNYANAQKVASYLESKIKPDEYVFTNFQLENLLNEILYKHSLFPSRDILKRDVYAKHTLDFSDFPKRIANGEVRYWVGEANAVPDTFYNGDFRQHFEYDTTITTYSIYRYTPVSINPVQ